MPKHGGTASRHSYNNNNMKHKELQQRISNSDQLKLETYIRLYDRMILHYLVCKMMPEESIDKLIKWWEKAIKKSIDDNAKDRTSFLESTIAGRRAKIMKEPDGEKIRLDSVKTFELARDIITRSLSQVQSDPEFGPLFDEDDDDAEENSTER